jgi:hypothetical protein
MLIPPTKSVYIFINPHCPSISERHNPVPESRFPRLARGSEGGLFPKYISIWISFALCRWDEFRALFQEKPTNMITEGSQFAVNHIPYPNCSRTNYLST